MARPRFLVKHFIACTNAGWEGLAGPYTSRILEGVNYYYTIPPDAESPELDFWLYARFYLTNGRDCRRKFSVDLYWLDAPGGVRWLLNRPLGYVSLRSSSPVLNVAWPLAKLRFPGVGQYEFRLTSRYRSRLTLVDRVFAFEIISIGHYHGNSPL